MIRDRKHPHISIILPARGNADCITIALESILCQTKTDFELIVVGDGTAGASADVPAGQNDPRIVVIQKKESSNNAAAFNGGIAAAGGELVGFIRPGDAWDERKLEEQVSCFSLLSPEYGVVYSDTWEISPAGNRAYWHSPEMDDGDLLNEYATDFQAAGLDISPVLVRRSVLERAGPFDESLGCFSDMDMIIRLSRICRFHHIGKPLCHRRSRMNSPDRIIGKSIARLLLLQKYPEVLHNQLFVAHQADQIRRALWMAREGIPSSPARNTPEPEPGYYRKAVLDL
ncbi:MULTISPECIES: glycosyltransferase [unclassified Methanoregula]|uniref:glycosyltransferase family 2 protein n=1 Tax=unclassified Methanoregula TaxID=2649730 RepID=UPI0009C66456|nr:MULTISPECIES: glycosyltransferase [unclassified Methanoregula]OPX63611.1 MAG: putative glycosyl transferase [Methanoregula sp. PtaB.Bin085]OPY36223.1 MAG: putative glycosyl transferase [Methanoregula sp. PtaU1.Bin006]